jgi:hypothetical protein
MCDSAWHSTPPGRRQVRERQRIRGRPFGTRKTATSRSKMSRTLLDAFRAGVVAVGERRSFVRPRNGGKNFRRDRRRIVTREIHAGSRYDFS